jgi:hypothetical protein
MHWEQFAVSCPEIARRWLDRVGADRLVMVGTLRVDGSPRISPCEAEVVSGELILGMMWRSRKAVDLLRDPRTVVHNATRSADGSDGDVKLYGRAEETDEHVHRAYRDAVEARLGWRPPDHAHIFVLDIDSAAFVQFGDDGTCLAWDPARGMRHLSMPFEG